jgi:hypothetical protein
VTGLKGTNDDNGDLVHGTWSSKANCVAMLDLEFGNTWGHADGIMNE